MRNYLKHTGLLLSTLLCTLILPASCSRQYDQDLRYKQASLYSHYCRKGLYDSLSLEATAAFSRRTTESDPYLTLLSGLHSAQAAIFLDNYPKAMAYLDTLSELSNWEDFPELKAMYHGIRASYSIKDGFDYPSALIHLTEAINYFRNEEDALNTCTALFNISMIYFFRRDTVGLKYAREAIDISSRHKDDPYISCTAEVVMSMMLLIKGDYSRAMHYALEAKQQADTWGYELVKPRIYMVLGTCALERGEMQQADSLLQCGFKAAENSDPDFFFELAQPYGKMLMETGRFNDAEDFLTGALTLVNKNDNVRYRYRILELLSELAETQGDTDAALTYYKMSTMSRDSILDINKETAFNNLLDLYEKASLQNLIRKRQNDIYFTLFICIISIICGIFFFTRYNRQRKINAELVQRNYEYQRRSEMLRKYLKSEKDTDKETSATDPSEEDLFGKLEKLMREDKIYRSNDISLERLASLLGTNRTYISRVINRYAEKTFWGYINMYRIAEATRILSDLESDIQIKNFYTTLGYNSPTSFFRVFKEEVGLSPSNYRDEIRRLKARQAEMPSRTDGTD